MLVLSSAEAVVPSDVILGYVINEHVCLHPCNRAVVRGTAPGTFQAFCL